MRRKATNRTLVIRRRCEGLAIARYKLPVQKPGFSEKPGFFHWHRQASSRGICLLEKSEADPGRSDGRHLESVREFGRNHLLRPSFLRLVLRFGRVPSRVALASKSDVGLPAFREPVRAGMVDPGRRIDHPRRAGRRKSQLRRLRVGERQAARHDTTRRSCSARATRWTRQIRTPSADTVRGSALRPGPAAAHARATILAHPVAPRPVGTSASRLIARGFAGGGDSLGNPHSCCRRPNRAVGTPAGCNRPLIRHLQALNAGRGHGTRGRRPGAQTYRIQFSRPVVVPHGHVLGREN